MLSLLFTVVLILIAVGILLWAIQAMPWIDADLKQVAKIVIVVILAFYLIGVLAGMVPAPSFRFTR